MLAITKNQILTFPATRLALVGLVTFCLSATSVAAQEVGDFDCDFDSVMETVSGDASCDYSADLDGSFDVSCDFSHDDDATDTSVSGDFDASCDVDESGFFECDYSSSYDYDSPTKSVSRSLSCDTLGSGEILDIDCGDKEAGPEVHSFLKGLDVTCGIPQDFDSIFRKLVDSGDVETALPLLDTMRKGVKSVEGMEGQVEVFRRLKKAKNHLKEGRNGKAKRMVRRAQRRAAEEAETLPVGEVDKLCASSLYCFVE